MGKLQIAQVYFKGFFVVVKCACYLYVQKTVYEIKLIGIAKEAKKPRGQATSYAFSELFHSIYWLDFLMLH